MELKKTHLYKYHKEHGRLVEFAGFEMPIWYEGIISEHLTVRNSVGIFDVTHMGRSVVEGSDADKFLNYVLSRDVLSMELMQGRYSVMLNERGGIIDDLTIFRLEEKRFLIVYNAANRDKDYRWLIKNAQYFNVDIKDVSDDVVMFAVQGPKAVLTLQKISEINILNVRRYWAIWTTIGNYRVLLTRTGYTGEDGFEVYLWDTPMSEAEHAIDLWMNILKAGQEYNIKPCGLGARDTLRLEAGMCLYDNDINEEITPIEANLNFTVSFDKENFIGKSALMKQRKEGIKKIRVGIKIIEKGIPRKGYNVLYNDKIIGKVTSGCFSPILKCGICMAYVDIRYSSIGTKVSIDIRGKNVLGEIVNMPFYDINVYGWRRVYKKRRRLD